MDKKQIVNLIGGRNLTVSETMQRIDKNTYGILFLTEESDKLIGCITDGDIRRYLLAGGNMSDQAIKAANKTPRVARTIEEAQHLYHKKNYIMIPIVDEEGEIIDLFSGDSELTNQKQHAALNIPVVINAGGKGTRLDPFTKVLPKPLIPVGDIPIIELIMKEYQSYACDDFHIIVNYKKELMKAYFADNENHYNITWYDEEIPLGTGGGLSLLRDKIWGTFFFINCDALLKANYSSILDFHKENKNAITMVCAYKNYNIPYGVVEIGLNGAIKNMQEKPLISFLANTGIYIVEPDIINHIPENTALGFPDIIEMERQKGEKVAVFPVSENDWMDMGQLPELEKMRIKMYGE